MAENKKIYNIGYAMNPKKLRKSETNSLIGVDLSCKVEWKGGGLADIIYGNLDGEPVDNIKFTLFDGNASSDEQSTLDAIIHKLTEELEQSITSDRVTAIESYVSANSSTIVLDPLDSVRNVTSRERSCKCLDDTTSTFKISQNQYILTQPKYFVANIGDLNEHAFLSHMTRVGIQFPIICKPVTACGSPEAHLMAVVVRIEDIHLIRTPCVVQQYYDHDSILYKVYVLGDDVMVFKRLSLPNITQYINVSHSNNHHNISSSSSSSSFSSSMNSANDKDKLPMIRSVIFDSRHDYPTINQFITSESTLHSTDPTYHGKVVTNTNITPDLENSSSSSSSNIDLKSMVLPVPMECFQYAATQLKSKFGLTMFGFDVIFPLPELQQYHQNHIHVHSHKVVSHTTYNSHVNNLNTKHLQSINHMTESSTQTTQISLTEDHTTLKDTNDRGLNDTVSKDGETTICTSLIVVDVNYFPSYKEVPDFPHRLRQYIKQRVDQHQITPSLR